MLQAAGGGVFFTTKELKAFSQSYREARAEYNESQQDLVRNIQQVRNNSLAEIQEFLAIFTPYFRPS